MLGKKRSSNKRFSLLLLQENEIYYEDFACTYFTNNNMSYKGRLHFCSHSLFFVADDIRIPILRFPINKMKKDKPIVPFVPGVYQEQYYKPHSKDSLFEIHTTQIIEMRKNNKDHPYIFRNITTKQLFGFMYLTTRDFLKKISSILNLWLNSNKTIHEIEEILRQQYAY